MTKIGNWNINLQSFKLLHFNFLTDDRSYYNNKPVIVLVVDIVCFVPLPATYSPLLGTPTKDRPHAPLALGCLFFTVALCLWHVRSCSLAVSIRPEAIYFQLAVLSCRTETTISQRQKDGVFLISTWDQSYSYCTVFFSPHTAHCSQR